MADLSKEPENIYERYGPESKKPGTYAANCILARRLAERNVRFIQLYHRGWDQHGDLKNHLPKQCHDVDQASSALVQDLKQRGLFEDTLILWGGEFGRTPTVELSGDGKPQSGRDHNHWGFSVWLAGGGIKGGTIYGATDDIGFKAVDKPTSVHDLHATMLHCLGFDHKKLTFRYAGRDFRLTDVHGEVINEILA